MYYKELTRCTTILRCSTSRGAVTEIAPRVGYLIEIYLTIFLDALKRSRFTRKDLSGLIFLVIAPFFYFSGAKIIKSPIGLLYIGEREFLRSIVYGFFKTHFCYLKYVGMISPKSHFSVIVDVGANLGDFALETSYMADRVVAIEPGGQNFRNLEENLKINCITNILPLNLAATDSCRRVFMEGNSSDLFVSSEGLGEAVSGFPLDTVCDKLAIQNIDILKVDVQGHEMSALAGMSRLLGKKSAKIVVVEVHLKRGIRTDDVVSLMGRYGYFLGHKDDFLFSQPHLFFTTTNHAKSKN